EEGAHVVTDGERYRAKEIRHTVTVNVRVWREHDNPVRAQDANPDVHEDRGTESVENINLSLRTHVPNEAEDHEQHRHRANDDESLVVDRDPQGQYRDDAQYG